MLVSLSKILVILVLVQCVRSIEFYKSKRVPPKYKEIRRTYSLKNKEENVDVKSAETFVNKNLDQDTSIGNVKTTDDKQPSFSTSASDQDEESIYNVQTTENNQPSLPTSTIKPKRRPFNLRPLKKKVGNAQSKPVKTDVNDSDDQDKVSIGEIQSTNKKQPSLTTSTTKPKRRLINRRLLKNKGENAQRKPVERFVNENVDQVKVSIENIQTTEEKEPSFTTSTIKPKRRPFNLRPSKNKGEKAESKPVETFANVNADQDTLSNGNVQTIGEKTPAITTSTVRSTRPTINLYSLKRKEENTESKPIETIVNENTDQDKVSTGKVQTTGDEKPTMTTSTVNPKTPTLNVYSLESKKQNTAGKPAQTKINENADPDEVSFSSIQITEDEKPTVTTNTVKPKAPTLNLYSLKKEEEKTDSKRVETKINENTDQDNVSISNIQTSKDNKPTITASTVKPRTRTLNLYSLKNKEENINSKPVETLVNENTDQDKVSTSNAQTIGDKKLNLTTNTVKPRRRTLNLYSLKKKEENTESKPIGTLTNEGNDQNKVSTSNVQTTREKKLSIISSTIKPKRRNLNLDTMKINEGNPNSKPVETFVNNNSDQEKVSTDNVLTDMETTNKKPTSTTTTVKPKRRTLNGATSERGSKRIVNSTQRKIVVQETRLNAESKPNTGRSTVFDNSKYEKSPKSFTQMEVTVTQAPQLNSATSELGSKRIVNSTQRKIVVQETRLNAESKPNTGRSTVFDNSKNEKSKSFTQMEVTVTQAPQLNGATSELGSKRIVNSTQRKIVVQETRLNAESKPNTGRSTVFDNSKYEKSPKSFTQMEVTVTQAPQLNSATSELGSKRIVNSTQRKIVVQETRLNAESKPNTGRSTVFDNSKNEKSKSFTQMEVTVTQAPQLNGATSERGSKRIVNSTQRKIVVQETRLNAESKPNTGRSTVFDNSKNEKSSKSFTQMEVTVTQAPQLYKKYYQSTTPYAQLEKTPKQHDTFVPIVGIENYVYAYNGDYHYSYEGGDGTKAFERGELKAVDGRSNTAGVVGGYSYKDKDGNDFSLSYTAGEGGYRPVGAHLPTSPPIPPAIQRVLRILATKTTPEPITEKIQSDY